jgi:hypothetical protein
MHVGVVMVVAIVGVRMTEVTATISLVCWDCGEVGTHG